MTNMKPQDANNPANISPANENISIINNEYVVYDETGDVVGKRGTYSEALTLLNQYVACLDNPASNNSTYTSTANNFIILVDNEYVVYDETGVDTIGKRDTYAEALTLLSEYSDFLNKQRDINATLNSPADNFIVLIDNEYVVYNETGTDIVGKRDTYNEALTLLNQYVACLDNPGKNNPAG